MDDQQTAEIMRYVHRFLDGIEGEGLDVGKAESFERMVDYVQSHVPLAHQIEDDELRAVTAMCWLGPRAGIPPQRLREELIGIIRHHAPEPDERCGRIMEFVIAYGCGKFRDLFKGEGEWHERWPGAMQALQRALEPSVRKSDRWLRMRARVVGYPQKENADLCGEAWVLTLRLIHPEMPLHLTNSGLQIQCTDDGVELLVSDSTDVASSYFDSVPNGSKIVFTVIDTDTTLWLREKDLLSFSPRTTVIIAARDDEARITAELNGRTERARIRFWESAWVASPVSLTFWRCTCGHKRCADRHRLEAWQPNEVRLWSFVASAVKGPQPSVQVGSFIAGMYFSLLVKGESGSRLRLADLEYKVCHHCSTFSATPGTGGHAESIDRSPEPDKEDLFEYEGLCCPQCRNPFDPIRSHRGTHERFILVADFAPHYRPSLRIRCKNKKTHYRITADKVPPATLTERWENLFTVPSSWSYQNVRDARRAIADDDYLRSKMEDPPAYLSESVTNDAFSEKELRKRFKEWLRAPLEAACPLCGEEQSRQFNVVWERTFARVKQLDSNGQNDAIHEEERQDQIESYARAVVAGLHGGEVNQYEQQSYD